MAAHEQISGSIYSYLHPDYWGGHSIGIGEPALKEKDLYVRNRSADFVARTLGAYLDDPAPRIGIETFSLGDTFDPSAYAPGTITLAIQESVTTDKGALPDASKLRAATAATSRVLLPMGPKKLRHDTRGIGTADGSIIFAQSYEWGVVAPGPKGAHALVHVIDLGIGVRDGRIAVPRVAQQARKVPITIGRVEHTKVVSAVIKQESVRRTNWLEVRTYLRSGPAEPQPGIGLADRLGYRRRYFLGVMRGRL